MNISIRREAAWLGPWLAWAALAYFMAGAFASGIETRPGDPPPVLPSIFAAWLEMAGLAALFPAMASSDRGPARALGAFLARLAAALAVFAPVYLAAGGAPAARILLAHAYLAAFSAFLVSLMLFLKTLGLARASVAAAALCGWLAIGSLLYGLPVMQYCIDRAQGASTSSLREFKRRFLDTALIADPAPNLGRLVDPSSDLLHDGRWLYGGGESWADHVSGYRYRPYSSLCAYGLLAFLLAGAGSLVQRRRSRRENPAAA